MKNIKIIALAVFLFAGNNISAQTKDTTNSFTCCSCCRPDGDAPLGVMTDHTHGKGQWMISYSFMEMMTSGNRNGTARISDDEIFQNYFASVDKMTMTMNMFMVMYGITDKLSVMAMANINSNKMSMNMDPTMQMHMADGGPMPPANMTSSTTGVGDTKLYATYNVQDKMSSRILLGLGVSIPTGSIEQTALNVSGDTTKSTYSMQLGTGSFSIIPAVTYAGQESAYSWGVSAFANIVTGANSEGYQWGNQYTGTGWFSYKFSRWISASIRAEVGSTGKIMGYDNAIALYSANDPTANTGNYGGTHGTAFLGINFYVPDGSCKDLRLAIEYGIPFYQNLNGIQPSMQSSLEAGIRYMF